MELTHTESILVEAPPEAVYALVSDVTRTGEWSPICRSCEWEDPDVVADASSPREGAWFTGHNEHAGRVWDTRSQVVVADPGREFAWTVGQGFVRWGYQVAPAEGGAELTETWEFLPDGLAFFREKFGDDADAQIADRAAQAHASIPTTLAAIKQIAESA